MPAYHSSAPCAGVDRVGNVALLPIKCSIRGPVPSLPKDSKDPDIIDEALQYFKVRYYYVIPILEIQLNYCISTTDCRLFSYFSCILGKRLLQNLRNTQ